jgi:DNA-cytosine methyltransferase
LPKIDLLIGGSPCQGFSFAGKQLAFDDERSKLFFEFVRLKDELQPTYFLLENVKMKKEFELIISQYMKVAPIEINSALVSAQNRVRLYWTNINNKPYGLFGDMFSDIPQPKDKGILLKDVLETEVLQKFFLSEKILNGFANSKCIWKERFKPHTEDTEKSYTLTSRYYKMGHCDPYILVSRGRNPENPKSRQSGLETEQMLEPRFDSKTNCITSVQKDNLVLLEGAKIRRLTPKECERLQTVPDNFTSCVSDTQRYRMLGNGWTVDVIAHIFSFLKWHGA